VVVDSGVGLFAAAVFMAAIFRPGSRFDIGAPPKPHPQGFRRVLGVAGNRLE